MKICDESFSIIAHLTLVCTISERNFTSALRFFCPIKKYITIENTVVLLLSQNDICSASSQTFQSQSPKHRHRHYR